MQSLASGLLIVAIPILLGGAPARAVEPHNLPATPATPPSPAPPSPAPPPSAQGQPVYGSIAYDKTDCSWGRSWNYPNQSGADDRATSECSGAGGKQCQVVTRVGPNQCGAIAATTGNCSGYGWAVRPAKQDAEQEAIHQCKSYNPSATCELKVSVCSSQ